MNRAVVSLPLPGDVLTMISTLRVGCHTGAAIAAAAKPRTPTKKAEKKDAKVERKGREGVLILSIARPGRAWRNGFAIDLRVSPPRNVIGHSFASLLLPLRPLRWGF
jgi:hypothetical protein